MPGIPSLLVMGDRTLLSILGQRRRVAARLEQMRERLLRLALSWTRSRDRAEDLVQDCFTRSLEKSGSLQDESCLEIWVTRIMSRLYLDQTRRKNLEVIDKDFEQICDDRSDPVKFAESIEFLDRIEVALGKISDESRQIVTLIDIGGYSYAECAQILEVPVGTIMSRLSRGRDRLAKLIMAEQDSAPKIVKFRR